MLACRQIDAVDPQMAKALGLDPSKHLSCGLVTCDQDDALYVALDHCTKFSNVDVMFGRSFYAGSKHSSGPFSGEVMGIVAGSDPDEVAEALWALRNCLREEVRFQTFPGENQPAFLAHVISEPRSSSARRSAATTSTAATEPDTPPASSVWRRSSERVAAPRAIARWKRRI